MIEAIPPLLTPSETVSYLGYVLSCQEFEEFRNPTTRLTLKLNKDTAQLQTANGNKLNLDRILMQIEQFLNIVAELYITAHQQEPSGQNRTHLLHILVMFIRAIPQMYTQIPLTADSPRNIVLAKKIHQNIATIQRKLRGIIAHLEGASNERPRGSIQQVLSTASLTLAQS